MRVQTDHMFGSDDVCTVCGCPRNDAERRRWSCLTTRNSDERLLDPSNITAWGNRLRDLQEALDELDYAPTESEVTDFDVGDALLALRSDGEDNDEEDEDWPDAAVELRSRLRSALIAKLVAMLPRCDDVAVREVAKCVADLGAAPAAARDVLLARVNSPDPFTRREVLRALGAIAPSDHTVLATACERSSDEDQHVRASAIRLLGGWMGETPDEVRSLCVKALDDKRAPVRTAAAEAVGRLRLRTPAVRSRLSDLLSDRSMYVRDAADAALRQLDDADEGADQGAAAVSRSESTVAERCVPLLSHPNATVRASACEQLARLASVPDSVVNELIKALRDAKPSVRTAAARALGSAGCVSTSGRTKVLALLSNGTRQEKLGAVTAFAESTWRGVELVDPLLRVFESDLTEAYADAIAALSKIPGALRDRERLLERLTNHRISDVRAAVIRALRSADVADEVAVRLTTSALRDGDDSVRLAAVQTLESLGPRARNAFAAMLEVAQHDDDSTVRYLAGRALHELGPGSTSAIPELMRALAHEDDDVAASAASALGAIGPAASVAEPLLLKVAREERYSRRSDAATEALITIMGEAYWRRHLASD